LIQAFNWVLTSIEVAVIVANVDPSSPLSAKILSILVANNRPALATSDIRVTPVFLVGWLFVLSGSLIRHACFCAMGNLFTFELSMRKDHRLITSGPYSVVRHPSYTGLIMAILGCFLCYLSGGSWLKECSWLSLNGTVGTGVRLLISAWVVGGFSLVLGVVARIDKEDTMLRKEFREWDQWARNVPWKLIPFVY
jgi:protein-S-isoprenylcysteine O-methyltransferase Ste14